MTKWQRKTLLKVGGQAEVWLAQSDTGEQAVMKRLLKTPQLEDPDAELRRFHREVRCQIALQHVGIMPILGSNFKTDPPFYIMPKAEETLADRIDDNPDGMSPQEAASIFLEKVDAIDYAHQQGVYHRDLKPANVLKFEDKWRVGDFGMCRDLNTDSTTITRTHSVIGTVAYMAPEQYDNGHEITPAADIFSLGRILYHMLTGKVPFPYCPIDKLPAEFRYLVSRSMAEESSSRYATVAEFGRQVDLIVSNKVALTPPIERGKELLTRALTDFNGAAGELLSLILENADDDVFFTEFVARLPRPILETLQDESASGFANT